MCCFCRFPRAHDLSLFPLLHILWEIYVFAGTVNNDKHLLGVMFLHVCDQG